LGAPPFTRGNQQQELHRRLAKSFTRTVTIPTPDPTKPINTPKSSTNHNIQISNRAPQARRDRDTAAARDALLKSLAPAAAAALTALRQVGVRPRALVLGALCGGSAAGRIALSRVCSG